MRSEDVSVLLSARHAGNSRNNRRKAASSSSAAPMIDDKQSDDVEVQDVLGSFRRLKVSMGNDLLTPATAAGDQQPIEDDEVQVVDVALPIIVERQRDTKSAFEIQNERIDRIMQASGAQALQKLYTVRHGAQSRKPATSTAGAETKHALEEQYLQFEEGVRSIPDDVVPPSDNDLSRSELFGSLLKLPAKDAENMSVRTLSSVDNVETRRRATEEEYLRAPFYPGELECRNGKRCQGNFATRVGGFTLVEYNSLELVRRRAEYQERMRDAQPTQHVDGHEVLKAQLCVMCSRMLQQERWATSAARNCAYSQESVPDILPDYHNLIGSGEYDAHHVYSCSKNKIQFPELPVVIFCNTSFRRSERQMDDGTTVPEYKQVLIKPEVPAFRDGRV